MTTDELEQAIIALQDRVLLFSRRQCASYRASRAALHRLVARRAQIAKREPQHREA